LLHPLTPAVNMLNLRLVTILQTVFENTLMEHHVAFPPGSMGKISYIAPAGQYSLQVSRYHTKAYCFSASLAVHFAQFYLTSFSLLL
jgi:vacuolar-type H+-ATPase catalytic subunit A/Vma1